MCKIHLENGKINAFKHIKSVSVFMKVAGVVACYEKALY
jgi:hypothetical protein